jgi:hypothetical protein
MALVGCASNGRYVDGTRIPYSEPNKTALAACEEYRMAVETGDADKLMLLAHPQYWEDSGTPSGGDDYGYDGLRNVLTTRLQKASDIRYSVRYVAVQQGCKEELQNGCKAAVDILIDASFTVTSATGQPKRPDKRDQGQLLLQWTCGNPKEAGARGGGGGGGGSCRWLFLAGM